MDASSPPHSSTTDFHDFQAPPHPRTSTIKSDSTTESRDFDTTIHGNCPHCHHHHDAKSITFHISRRGSFPNRITCARCNRPWFRLGGYGIAHSLLSQETDSSRPSIDSPPSIYTPGFVGGCYTPTIPSNLGISTYGTEEPSRRLSGVDEERSERISAENGNDPLPSQNLPKDHSPAGEHDTTRNIGSRGSGNSTRPPNKRRKGWLKRALAAPRARLGQVFRSMLNVVDRRRQPRSTKNIPAIGYHHRPLSQPSTHSVDLQATTPLQSPTPAKNSTSRPSIGVSSPDQDGREPISNLSSVSPLSSSHPMDGIPVDEPIEPLDELYDEEARKEEIKRVRAIKSIQKRSQQSGSCQCTPDCPHCRCASMLGSEEVHPSTRAVTPISQLDCQPVMPPHQHDDLDGVGDWHALSQAGTSGTHNNRESVVTYSSQAETNVSLEFEGLPPPAAPSPPQRPYVNTYMVPTPRHPLNPRGDVEVNIAEPPVEDPNHDSAIDMDPSPLSGVQHSKTWPFRSSPTRES
jgi:hypothetical protein